MNKTRGLLFFPFFFFFPFVFHLFRNSIDFWIVWKFDLIRIKKVRNINHQFMDASFSATTILVRHLRCQSHSFRVEGQISKVIFTSRPNVYPHLCAGAIFGMAARYIVCTITTASSTLTDAWFNYVETSKLEILQSGKLTKRFPF